MPPYPYGGNHMNATTILKMNHITKTFPGVKALDDVSFSVEPGTIHFIVGENGAGKSTLMKVLSGIHSYGSYEGDIEFDGAIRQFHKIDDSEKAGLVIINQELALIPEMTVYENIFLAHEVNTKGVIDWNETIHRSSEELKRVQLNINPGLKVKDLNVGQQQLVEIAKALSKKVKLLILDEPTAALNENDSQRLLNLLVELKEEGITSIMISHKLKETIIADRVTVMRDGKTISTLEKSEIDEARIIKDMVGRPINDIYPKRPLYKPKEVVMDVRHLTAFDHRTDKYVAKDVQFQLHKGEVMGLAGLMGAGRSEIALSIFGNPKKFSMDIDMSLLGEKVHFKHPSEAIKKGLFYVSEDRKAEGLVLKKDVKENVTLSNLGKISQRFVIDKNAEIRSAQEYVDHMNVKTPSLEQLVYYLSGGNQQKVAISKALFVGPKILILDEPTRGIDVGAKFEIYTLINQLIEEGMSIIMISSELPELLAMSDRLLVVAEGQIKKELHKDEFSPETVMKYATS